jgi:TRAP-type C4-dicarboxylate transport system permease small subunit
MVEERKDSSVKGSDGLRVPVAIEEAAAAVAMGIICLITMANVVVRYFTAVSFAFTEEFSVFLMVFLTFAGAAAAFARNRHIRMTFIVERLPPGLRRKAEHLALAASLLMFLFLTWYGTFLFWDDWKFGTTSPGIGIPQWIYSLWLPLLSLVILLRILGRWKRFFTRLEGERP